MLQENISVATEWILERSDQGIAAGQDIGAIFAIENESDSVGVAMLHGFVKGRATELTQ